MLNPNLSVTIIYIYIDVDFINRSREVWEQMYVKRLCFNLFRIVKLVLLSWVGFNETNQEG